MGYEVSHEERGTEKADTRPLKVLISAYACEPGKGSEPGIGWNVAREVALRHEVWVVTRANNRAAIEAELARRPSPHLHPVYYDLPRWARWWKRGSRGIQLYYYLWQFGIYSLVRRLHRDVRFDVVHHVTLKKYWMPSLLGLLPVPFVWGSVGGGESAPRAFRWRPGSREGLYEAARDIARWCGEQDPLVLLTARRSELALADTEQTADRLRALGARQVRVVEEAGVSETDLSLLGALPVPPDAKPLRFLSLGRMLGWKGFHLGLRAFAAANLADSEYWLIGDGPHSVGLRRLARTLGIEERVRFWGALPWADAVAKLAQCHVLVHPSLHDSAGSVCLEAMAAGRPVICLDLGGPGLQVTQQTGLSIPAHTPDQVVRDLAAAMVKLAEDPQLRCRIGRAGKERVASTYMWRGKGELFSDHYLGIARRLRSRTVGLEAVRTDRA
jgi:glycosyltransferase involved in cell wall biosynthesis